MAAAQWQKVVRARRRFWAGHLQEWLRSGLSQAKYCRRHQLSATTFAWWKTRGTPPAPSAVRVFVHTAPTDMRRSFDRLAPMAQEVLHQDPFSGHLSVFVNRARDRMKILFWDRSGCAPFYKRLEEGVFHLPAQDGAGVEIDVPRLALILEGLEPAGAKQ